MESLLGFHPPHFSEDSAWLPGWLQPSTIRDASYQALQCPSGQGLEEIGCYQQNNSARENDKFSDNGTCKSFHLFLSGEDNSSMNFPSCSSNHEVRYHLHLSSFEESQNLSNPISSKSQPENFEPSQPLIKHQPDSKVTPEENHNPSQQKGNLGISSHEPKGQNEKNHELSSQKGDLGTSSHEPKGQNGKTHNKNPKSRKVDITDAIELAVAASEALIIHELLKDEPSTQLSTPSSVLEAAIRVKQARLEEFKEILGFDESSEVEVDYLSDLDELTMADACEDVGLTVINSHGDLSGYESVSHVKDSYGGLEAEFSSISSKEKILLKRGFVLDSIEGGTYKEDVDYNADLGCDIDHVFEQSEVRLQKEGEMTSCQTILKSSGCKEREDEKTNLIPDRFQSRWFGGWTCKNEVPFTENKHNETSSLSESADIAPDMNSAIQKQDNTVSQSSIAPKDTHNKTTNNGNSPSDDITISQSNIPPKDTHEKTTITENFLSLNAPVSQSNEAPSVSPMDLLCSVVPCSFSSDNTLPHNNTPDVNLDNPKIVPPQSNEKAIPISDINNDNSTIRRTHVTSLKTYSMLSCPQYNPTEKKTKLPPTVNSEENPNPIMVPERLPLTEVFRKVKSNIKSCLVPMRKRVRFSEPEFFYPPVKKIKKHRVTYNKTLFQDLKFLLTGFSVKKHKEIKNLIQKNGGTVLEDIPSPNSKRRKSQTQTCPIILCPKRLLTTKFLYGCAVNACIIKVKWLFDSVNEGVILPPKKYLILKENVNSCGVIIGRPVSRNNFIFENVAIMIHGKQDFCVKMGKVVRHGGGMVFKTFHWLVKRVEGNSGMVGAIVVEGENGISRQLKQCAVEKNIVVVTFDWIVKSLYEGRVVFSKEIKEQSKVCLELSEEI